MKKVFLKIIISVLILNSCGNSQNISIKNENLEYEFINQTFYKVLNLKKSSKTVKLNRLASNLIDLKIGGELFFSKKNFKNYTFPVIGVDNVKIQYLIDKLDFNYFKKNLPENHIWEKEKLKIHVRLTNKEPSETDEIIYHLSKPIFNKDKSFVFILYSQSCLPYINCDGKTVKIYKRTGNKWMYYTEMPISLN
jgi:hypothetical protein